MIDGGKWSFDIDVPGGRHSEVAFAVACVGGVLREHGEAILGSLRVEHAECLLQVVVDRERTLFAGLVFDAGDHVAVRADEIDARDAVPKPGGRQADVRCVSRARFLSMATPSSVSAWQNPRIQRTKLASNSGGSSNTRQNVSCDGILRCVGTYRRIQSSFDASPIWIATRLSACGATRCRLHVCRGIANVWGGHMDAGTTPVI